VIRSPRASCPQWSPARSRRRLIALSLLPLLLGATAPPTTAGKLFPSEIRNKLADAQSYSVIVLAARPKDLELETFLRKSTEALVDPGPLRIDLINGYAVKAKPLVLRRLGALPAVNAVWIIPEEYFDKYLATIRSIEYFVKNVPPPGIIMMFFSPPAESLPIPYREGEPIHLATRKATDAGNLVIMAAGDAGPRAGTLNPWCLARWVVCVGAATADGKKLWERTSRGLPGDPIDQLTVVAPGVDVLTTHPQRIPKTPEMLAAEKRIGFEEIIPPDERPFLTVASGSYLAAAGVGAAASQIFFYLKAALRGQALQRGGDKSILIPYSKPLPPNNARPGDRRRLAGEVKVLAGRPVAVYPAEPSPLIVKQILMDAAVPIPGYREHEIGHGFVSREMIDTLFKDYGFVKPMFVPFGEVGLGISGGSPARRD